ncbi:putative ribonuclease H-like domain-containing protein [Tanacetum coccineum]
MNIGFLENKPMIEGNGPKWLFDLDSLTQSMNYVPVVAGTFSNDFAGIQGVSESSTSSQQDQDNQDCIVMPIWKDASYFDDASPRSVADAQIQDQNGLHDEIDDTEKTYDDSSLQNNGTADQQVNTARPEVNTGSREVSTTVPEVNTATLEDLVGPSPTSEDTQVEDQEIELGNIPQSYEVPTTPHTRIHKDHPKWHVDGDVLVIWKNNKAVLKLLGSHSRRMLGGTSSVQTAKGFEDPDHPNKVYKVVKALYGLYQAPRAWYVTLANYLLYNGFKREKIDQTLFIKRHKGHILLVQIYVDDIIFGSTKKELCDEFEKLMKDNQDKYVHEILRKFNYSDVTSASTPIDLEKPLVQDGVLLMLMNIFKYLKGKPSLGLWYSKDSPLELVAYTDSDYAGATQDRKSTTGGYQFLENRSISWACQETNCSCHFYNEARYVAAASCCRQVLGIQNQLLDYGYNFMDIVIYIDNTSTICIIENPVQHSKTKHIEIRHHFIRDFNAKKLIPIAKIDTQHNVADLLTKTHDWKHSTSSDFKDFDGGYVTFGGGAYGGRIKYC